MKTFFAQLKPEHGRSLENNYWAIWNQIFQLKEYCGFSLFELKLMTAEERSWYINRYKEEQEKKAKAEERASGKSRVPSMSKPSVRR